uniref:Putative SAM-dependent methyltransferases. Methyltransferase type 11 n=1 Tax=Magnetococcus massalia (strain MO-1) TaxID=451514 RepID=A0A1S7LLL9_MAGMO|nr:Putative SAM-dependent methyltransferases. Methyltransferase type 11 [Candidatus Magnetococcus massalia]
MSHHHHHPKHRFDPAKAERLLDPRRRMVEDPAALVAEMGVETGMQIADLGAGAGFFTKGLLQAVGETGHVAAIELQPQVLELFNKHVGTHANLESHEADLSQTPLQDGRWDAAFIAFTLHEVVVADALREIARILKPGGQLMALEWGAYEPCPDRPDGKKAGPPADHRLMPQTLTKQLDEAGFSVSRQGERLGGCQYWICATKAAS